MDTNQTENSRAISRVLKKLTAVRVTLSDDERQVLDQIVTGEAESRRHFRDDEAVAHAMTGAKIGGDERGYRDVEGRAISDFRDDEVMAHGLRKDNEGLVGGEERMVSDAEGRQKARDNEALVGDAEGRRIVNIEDDEVAAHAMTGAKIGDAEGRQIINIEDNEVMAHAMTGAKVGGEERGRRDAEGRAISDFRDDEVMAHGIRRDDEGLVSDAEGRINRGDKEAAASDAEDRQIINIEDDEAVAHAMTGAKISGDERLASAKVSDAEGRAISDFRDDEVMAHAVVDNPERLGIKRLRISLNPDTGEYTLQ